MLYHVATLAQKVYPAFHMVHFVSFRALAALLSTLMFSLFFGEWFIEGAKRFFRSPARPWTPERHRQKENLPSMGGLFILLVVVLNTLLWTNLSDPHIWVFLATIFGFGAIGAWDDWSKITRRGGVSAAVKFGAQIGVALLVTWFWLSSTGAATTITMPFFKHFMPDLGHFFVLWALFVLVAMSNGVNLTDGLDGLAIGSLIPNFATFAIVSYLAGHAVIAAYLLIPFAGTAELAVVSAILVGASLGFLWFNTYPAQIFMGDVGSLALGAALAIIALMAKQEMLLPIAGGLFVVETVTVILQVLSVKIRGKRIFKMAPIHHHFELLGWQESKITVRFAIISFVLCLLALITLKIR